MSGTTPAEASLYTGRLLGAYHVNGFLAEGGFGLVFDGAVAAGGSAVAVKICSIQASTDQQIEFRDEGRLLKRFRKSTHVLDYIDYGEEPIFVTAIGSTAQVPITVRYTVVELGDGTLEDLMPVRAHISFLERLRLFRCVVLGVHQMHLLDVVHRDLKTSNCIIFMKRKNILECKVADLGRARDLSQPARFPAQEYAHGRGDLRFAAPEMLWLQGVDDPMAWKRADVYGLGSILFELVTGQGITGVALGSGPAIAAQVASIPAAARASDFQARTNDLRARYEAAFQMFEASVPPAIRQPAGILIRQLCDPDPLQRFPRYGLGQRRSPDAGLEWLLRRTTILMKTIDKADAQASRLARRKARTHAANN